MSRYSEGVRVEHLVIDDLRANGYQCIRASSSKGVADVVAVKVGEVVLVNVKRTTMPGPAERLALWRLRWDCVLPVVALKPLRCPIEYRLLTGPGPKEWVPWTPDEALEGAS